ncbi:hypothetical protein ACFQ0I_02770 [Mariniflexile aquimaris]|uniref:Uncharacterized protein n=1 Tax=Mariniflexile aquimaris TaxID=881009 RepID=A0ABW3BPR6_9FLAO
MGAKNVSKIILPLVLFIITTVVFGQRKEYLLFDKDKDSIITIGNIKYFKIDNNLFNINKYNTIDTVNFKEIDTAKFTTVEELWIKGKQIHDSIIKAGNKVKKIKVIESYNQIFDFIYVLEKKSNCKFIRTRVWWIDY